MWGNKSLDPLIKLDLDEGQLNEAGNLFPVKEPPVVTE